MTNEKLPLKWDNIAQTNYLVVFLDGVYLKDLDGNLTSDVTAALSLVYPHSAHCLASRFPGARVAKRTITVEIVQNG